jgi:hypothetical protein
MTLHLLQVVLRLEMVRGCDNRRTRIGYLLRVSGVIKVTGSNSDVVKLSPGLRPVFVWWYVRGPVR